MENTNEISKANITTIKIGNVFQKVSNEYLTIIALIRNRLPMDLMVDFLSM